ncbi:O-antigen ligase family protein [Methylosinus sporium]|uniref:O-antigen ligase family protein n=1 Tax=Methylosinus sporium TaxID=428 RepID=UPI00383ACF28
MTDMSASSAGGLDEIDGRGILFCAILLVGWITFSPFADLASPETLELAEGRDIQLYAAFGLMAAAAFFYIWRTDRPALAALATPTNIALAGWIGVTLVTSHEISNSLKRVVMFGCVGTCSLSLFLLPRGRDDLAKLLSIVALIIVGLSYFGLVFLPHYTIHQATDIGEPQLAGDWRGVFGHKNVASAVFSMLTFIGIFVLRAGRTVEGWAIFVLSLLFVLCSGGKSSTAICITTILLSLLAERTRNVVLWSIIVFSPLALLNFFGIGSILVPQFGAIAASLPLDASFTGRTDIWTFAIPKAAETPIFGHGLGGFWATAALRFGGEDTTIWAGNAAHAHNGYLDTVLAMGLPGLAFAFAALIVQPARDVRRVCARGDEPAVSLLFLQIWMFSLYLNSLESFFFDRANPGWIGMLFALFGLRFLAEFKIRG